MGYNNKGLVTDVNRKPVPQYFNPKTDQYEAISGRFGATDFIQKGTIAEEAWEGTANITKTFPSLRYGLSIVNDGIADLTFTVNGQTRRVKPGESYSSLFNAFTSVVISASSAYRAEVLS